MSNIVKRSVSSINLPKGVELSDTGLILPEGLSYADWREVGMAVARSGRMMAWCLGDWLVYGEHVHGEKYAQAASETGYSEGTLMNLASMCSRIPQAMRRPGLSMEHHRAVAFLESDEDKATWLDRAEEAGWSRDEFREKVSGKKPPKPAKQVREVTCPKCGHGFSV